MRVTNNMLVSNMIRNLSSNLRRMDTYQSQLSTGKQIQSASDDPVLASKILKFRTDISELGQFNRNVDDAQSWMEITESAVSDVSQVLQKIRELMVQAANSTNTAQETQKIADEVRQMKKQLILDGNATYAGRYIFSSYETNTKLFNEDGTYNVDITQYKLDNKPVSKFQVSVGEEMNTNTNGLSLFGVVPEATFLQTVLTDGIYTGTAATKSAMTGEFPLDQDYTADTMDITFGGNVYNVVEAGLDGSVVAITKETMLSRLQNADFAGNPLSDVADVFYDAQDRLIIKAKAPGATAISTASGVYVPDPLVGFVAGTAMAEASTTLTTPLTDGDVTSKTDELRKPFYLTLNGVTKRIVIDDMLPITKVTRTLPTDPPEYVEALQAAVDQAFGIGEVTVSGSDGTPIQFTTVGTPSDGTLPTIQLENIAATKSTLMEDLDAIIEALDMGSSTTIGNYLDVIDTHLGNVLTVQADIGARTNRLELILNRLEENNISFTKLLSSAEDADMAEIIMNLKNAENVYRASLSTGAKVIQPTLTDFLS